MTLMAEFGRVSGYHINGEKMEIMTWNMGAGVEVSRGEMRSQDINKLTKVNFEKVKKELSGLLKIWSHFPLFLFGRVNVIKKLLSSPSLLFFLTQSPYLLKKEWLKNMQSQIGSFIWAAKGPRIAWKKLRRIEKGGLALPELLFYSWDFLMKMGGCCLIDLYQLRLGDCWMCW